MKYVRITEHDELPDLTRYKPYRCVVIIENEVSIEKQIKMSDWLCESGCLYMMAWGKNCSSWDDSVDFANIRQFEDEDIPEEFNVITTWHDDEPLEEVFFFAKHCALHFGRELPNGVILHLSEIDKREELLDEYYAA